MARPSWLPTMMADAVPAIQCPCFAPFAGKDWVMPDRAATWAIRGYDAMHRASNRDTNRFHHDSNPAWQTAAINDQELLNFAERSLRFSSRR